MIIRERNRVDGKVVSISDCELSREQQEARVNAERDRRMTAFEYAGTMHKLDERGRAALIRIAARAQAVLAIDSSSALTFDWIGADNTTVAMTCVDAIAFEAAAQDWEAENVKAARAIKDRDTIPDDYRSDAYWPRA